MSCNVYLSIVLPLCNVWILIYQQVDVCGVVFVLALLKYRSDVFDRSLIAERIGLCA